LPLSVCRPKHAIAPMSDTNSGKPLAKHLSAFEHRVDNHFPCLVDVTVLECLFECFLLPSLCVTEAVLMIFVTRANTDLRKSFREFADRVVLRDDDKFPCSVD